MDDFNPDTMETQKWNGGKTKVNVNLGVPRVYSNKKTEVTHRNTHTPIDTL